MIARFALVLALVAALCGQAPAASPTDDPADFRPHLQLDAAGDSWMLSGDFEVPLTHTLEDAVRRGVPLYFVLEFELIRPRWWWADEIIARRSVVYRLAYHALTRQYRLNFDGLTQTWDTLGDATRLMSRVRHWRVFDTSSVQPQTRYVARVRLRLDAAQLPKPLQVNAITDRDWNPQTEWTDFDFRP